MASNLKSNSASYRPVFINWLTRRYDTQNRKAVSTDHGSKVKTDYQPVYDLNGVWHLEPRGKTNLYAEIQSHAQSCDINILMARYRNGETDILSRIQGVYGDVTTVPANYAEIMNQQLKAEQLFKSLAPDIRAKYNNSIEQFMASLSTVEGWKAIGFEFGNTRDAEIPNKFSTEAPSKGAEEVKTDGA